LTGCDPAGAVRVADFKELLSSSKSCTHCTVEQTLRLPTAGSLVSSISLGLTPSCSNLSMSSLYIRLPNWVGDVCMCLPTLAVASASGLPLVVCARPWARDLLAGLAPHDFIPMHGKLLADRAAVRAHRAARGADARGMVMPNSFSSAAVFGLAGIPSAGYRDNGRSLLLRWPIDKPGTAMHAVRTWYHLALSALAVWHLPSGPAEPPAELALPLTCAHEADAQASIYEAGLQPKQFVLIAPTATGLHKGRIKVWPHFDALARRLQSDGVIVAMCPPASEVDEARRNAPTALLLPPLGLGAFAALTRRAALVICNDSGVSHIAAAAGSRQLTLFGVTSPARTGPWSPRANCLGSNNHWPNLDAALSCVRKNLSSA
jgi:heptosyltransferase-2